MEISETENRKTTEKINAMKSWFFKNSHECIDLRTATLTNKNRKHIIMKHTHERRNIITDPQKSKEL